MSDEYLRNLAVPFLSQRINRYTWKSYYTPEEATKLGVSAGSVKDQISMACRSCNITSVVMVLRYFGINTGTPTELMQRYFERTNSSDAVNLEGKSTAAGALEDYNNLQALINAFYPDRKIITTIYNGSKKFSIGNTADEEGVKKEIASGYPVIISVRTSKTKSDYSGHIVVVRGFVKIGNDEYIILNDPWGSPADQNCLIGKDGAAYYGGYYNGSVSNDNGDGDNVIIKLSDFKKTMVYSDGSLHAAMTIHAPMWNFPDSSSDFSTDQNRASIYGNIDLTDGGFPLTAGSLWHNGIHIKINTVHSIGSGRLIAARNVQDKLPNGDASFALIRYPYVYGKSIQSFYCLYMHLQPFDPAVFAKTYFMNGKMETQDVSWPEQLFRRLYVFTYIGRSESDTSVTESQMGLLTQTYTQYTLYTATVSEDGVFYKGPVSDKKIERRVLVHPLPANNPALFLKLLSPDSYNDSDFIKGMEALSNYKKAIQNVKYLFFFYKNELLCIQAADTAFDSPVCNKKSFEYAAKKIYELAKGTTVTFSDAAARPAEYSVSDAVGQVYRTYSNTDNRTAFIDSENAYWQAAYETIRTVSSFDFLPRAFADDFYYSVLDGIYDLNAVNSNMTIQTVLKNELVSLSSAYAKKRKEAFVHYLKTLQNVNDSATAASPDDEKDANAQKSMTILKSYCVELGKFIQKTYKIPVSTAAVQTAGSGSTVVRALIDGIPDAESYPMLMKQLIESLSIFLIRTPARQILRTNTNHEDFFKVSDSCITELLKRYENVLEKPGTVYAGRLSCAYVDTFIEISKNEILGTAGTYKAFGYAGEGTPHIIHMELFSEKDLLQTSSDKQISDDDAASYFNAVNVVQKLKPLLPDEIKNNLRFSDADILDQEEILSFHTTVPEFASVACHHTSSWSVDTKWNSVIKDSNCLPESFSVTDGGGTVDSITRDEYTDKLFSPYMWMTPVIFDSKKRYFSDVQAWYYHPFYFLDELYKKSTER